MAWPVGPAIAVAEDVPVAAAALPPLQDVAAGLELLQRGADADGAQHLEHGFHHRGVAGELPGLPDDLHLRSRRPATAGAAWPCGVVDVLAGTYRALERERDDALGLLAEPMSTSSTSDFPSIA